AQGGSLEAPGVMPAELTIGGVCRTFDPAVRSILESRIRTMADSLAAAHGCSAEVTYYQSGWAVINAAEPAAAAAAAAIGLVGETNFIGDMPPSTGGEDFAEMMQVVPGCMASIGNGADEPVAAPRLHTPLFDFNDEAIPYGVAY